jgi:hypothetical protein
MKTLLKRYRKRRNCPPIRIYYQFRNEIWMKRIYGRKVYKNPFVLLKILNGQLFFEILDRNKIKAMFKSIRDGVLINPGKH